jgi:hypothetical protein
VEISLTELKTLIAGSSQSLPDQDYGWIVLILRNGFIFVGDTKRRDGTGYLRGYQVRFYEKREDGLPGFARGGRKSGDKLDQIEGDFEFPWSQANVIGVLPCGNNWKTAA